MFSFHTFPLLALCITSLTTSASAYPQEPTQESSSSTDYISDTSFRDAVLNSTNTYRAQHNATALTWNDTLADVARDWSEKCGFEHSAGPYGENLASGYPNTTSSIDAWGAERDEYDYKAGDFDTKTGHFTQLVWKGTTAVGCGRTECNGGTDGGKGDAPGWFVVCEYWPGGNVIGRFGENVQASEKEGGALGRRGGTGLVVWVAVGVVGVVLW